MPYFLPDTLLVSFKLTNPYWERKRELEIRVEQYKREQHLDILGFPAGITLTQPYWGFLIIK